tara:strand:- start:611 stop:1399 length:789 start_codon:yes stop_codon:yes gene_type:complete
MERFNKICQDIKDIKIQGATNVAKAGIKAYLLNPTTKSKKKLFSLRPTEPALFNALNLLKENSPKKIISHFDKSQEKINKYVNSKIKKNYLVYTHCHSSTITNALRYSKKKGKKFEVYNTETRPLYQGRKTARELAKEKIKVTTFIDSGMHEAIKNSDIIFIGADAILKSGVINKIGSMIVAEIAKVHKKPIYIVSDSWKFYPKNIKIEERDFHEVWKRAPKKIKIRNPAFEKIPKKYISGIISEKGILKYSEFIKKSKKLI